MLNVKPTLAGVLTSAALFIASQIEGGDERAEPGPECDTAQNDTAKAPSTLNQTVGAAVMPFPTHDEYQTQRRFARECATRFALDMREPGVGITEVLKGASKIAEFISDGIAPEPPRANLGLATNEEIISELDARYSMGHRAPGYKSTGRDTIS